jgi:four helix bundle protein
MVNSFRDLQVYQRSFDLAMKIFHLSVEFPKVEQYALTDQIRRSSRSVSANLAEAWGKRRYPAVFVNKLSDSEAESLETQSWLDFAIACNYLDAATGESIRAEYDAIVHTLVGMQNHHEQWCFPRKVR